MKLFIIHVGYYDYEVGMYELHSQFLIAAKTAAEAKNVAINKPIYKAKNMHIDGVQEINQIDGYSIDLKPTLDNLENKVYSYKEIKGM